MGKQRMHLADGLFMVIILVCAFGVNLLLKYQFQTQSMIPMIFVLGVFLVSWRTQGYFWGIAASMISVLAVNWAFTYPYWAFDLISPECISSAVVMLIVAVMTGTLTTKIKQQEKMKAEAEKERMRGNLLRAVSHDLRTPLTTIYGSTSMLLENYDRIPSADRQDLLRGIRDDAHWLVGMVENLLSVTRLDGGELRLHKTDTVLEELIKFRKRCPEQQVTVTIPEDFVSIPMDGVLIGQVLTNLLENAVFHAWGMTHLELEVRLEEQLARFTVRDDGCGIRDVEAAMQPFYSTGDGSERSGMGFCVMQTFMDAVEVDSTPGEGTTVTLRKYILGEAGLHRERMLDEIG